MRILIVSATREEVSFLAGNISSVNPGKFISVSIDRHSVDILITGVGMMLTAFHLGICLYQNKYDLALNIGLAGALNKELQLGEVVQVRMDSFADLGAVDDQSFINVFNLGMADENDFPFNQGKLFAQHPYQQQIKNLRTAEGITVNKVHGNADSIEKLLEYCKADVETMEGAAFFYACLYHKTDCIQIRSISNYVEKRNKSKWNIPLANGNLKTEVNNFLINVT